MSRARRWLGWGLAAVLAGSFLGGGAAHASVTGLQNVTGIMTINPGTVSTTTLSCPAGKLPVSGGFMSSAVGGAVVFQGSFPVGSGWRFEASTTGSPIMVSLRATCAAVTGYTVNAAPLNVPSGSTLNAVASCATGGLVLGGGWRTANRNIIPLRSAPDGNRNWRDTFRNTGLSSGSTTTYAICGAPIGQQILTATGVVNPNIGLMVPVTCPEGLLTTGGGYQVSGQNSWPIILTLRLYPEVWANTAYNSTATPFGLTSWAICVAG